MQRAASIIESEALTLPLAERAELVTRLLKSLDVRDAGGAKDIEAAWIAEASRRYEALASGADAGLTHEEVFGELRAERH